MNACLVYGMKGTVRVSAPLPFPVSTVAFFFPFKCVEIVANNLVKCVEIVAQNGSQLKRVVVFGFPIVVTDTPNYFISVDVDVEGGNFPPVPLSLEFFFGVIPQHGYRRSFPTRDNI